MSKQHLTSRERQRMLSRQARRSAVARKRGYYAHLINPAGTKLANKARLGRCTVR